MGCFTRVLRNSFCRRSLFLLLLIDAKLPSPRIINNLRERILLIPFTDRVTSHGGLLTTILIISAGAGAGDIPGQGERSWCGASKRNLPELSGFLGLLLRLLLLGGGLQLLQVLLPGLLQELDLLQEVWVELQDLQFFGCFIRSPTLLPQFLDLINLSLLLLLLL